MPGKSIQFSNKASRQAHLFVKCLLVGAPGLGLQDKVAARGEHIPHTLEELLHAIISLHQSVRRQSQEAQQAGRMGGVSHAH